MELRKHPLNLILDSMIIDQGVGKLAAHLPLFLKEIHQR